MTCKTSLTLNYIQVINNQIKETKEIYCNLEKKGYKSLREPLTSAFKIVL
jgi:hypothetical protein